MCPGPPTLRRAADAPDDPREPGLAWWSVSVSPLARQASSRPAGRPLRARVHADRCAAVKSCASESGTNRNVREDTIRADVVVVGGGSAGAVVARRLVEADMRVLLLESGGPDTNPAIHIPARCHELWFAEEDWAYHTVPQQGAAGRRLHWPRGRVLGGSGALNGMIHVRGAPADYDNWAYLGNAGWSWADVLPIFIAMEDYDRGASEFHGVGGPLHINTTWQPSEIAQGFRAAAADCGIPFNEDCNDGEPDGFSYVQMTVLDERRHSSAAADLAPVREDPLVSVELRAHARRLLLEGGRCVGVEFACGGELRTAHAEVEVVLAAGTIESPRLLMLSGIGPAEHLASLGIDVARDLPGWVGEPIHDHILSPVICSAEREIGPPPPGCWAGRNATPSGGAAAPASSRRTSSRSTSAFRPMSPG